MKKTIAQQLNVKAFPFNIKDEDGNEIYHETSDGYWKKREYDSDGKAVYFENSDGSIIDHRPKEIITLDGVKYQRIDQ